MSDGYKHGDNEKIYADIFHMCRPVSYTYPRMSDEERSAQFSPFAALVGYDDEIDESARVTDEMSSLSDDQMQELNERINILDSCAEARPPVKVTYFVSDEKKSGGMYISATGTFKSVDKYEKCIIINDRTAIPIETVVNIESPIFE